MARQPKLWRYDTGRRGSKVTARERVLGGNVWLFAYDPALGGYRKRSLRFTIRDAAGALIEEHTKRAESEADELSNRLRRGAVPGDEAPKPVTLGELVALFRRDVLPMQGEEWRTEAERELALWTAFLGERFEVRQLGAREWAAFIRERQSGEVDARGERVTKPEDRRPVAPRTVAKSLKVLRHLCRFGAYYRTTPTTFLLERDPTEGLAVPKVENPRRPVLDDTRYAKLIAAADRVQMAGPDGSRVRSYLCELLVLAHHTGRRIRAILHLRASDWRPDAGKHGALLWRVGPGNRKRGARERLVPVHPAVRATLVALLRQRPAVGEAFLFPAPADPTQPVDRHAATNWLLDAERLAGLAHVPGLGFHGSRRRWATARKGLPLADVAEAGGWTKDSSALLTCYQMADDETTEAVVLHERPVRAAR
jgi:integrase